jgi:hypothetical protein
MPEILTCRLQFTLVGTVFQSEEFHTVEAARAVGLDLQRHITARVSIVDTSGETVEVLP